MHCVGGEGGIRTHGPFQDNGFRDRPNRPLSHLSDWLVFRWELVGPREVAERIVVTEAGNLQPKSPNAQGHGG